LTYLPYLRRQISLFFFVGLKADRQLMQVLVATNIGYIYITIGFLLPGDKRTWSTI